MFGKIPVMCLSLFVLLSCKGQDFPVKKADEIATRVDFPFPSHATKYCMSGQLEEDGIGEIDIMNGYFYYQRNQSGYDSLALPEGFDDYHYCIAPNPNGNYYFIDAEMGLFLLTKKGPVLIDSLNSNPVLKEKHLAVLVVMNMFRFATFKDETHLVIPLSLNYDNLGKKKAKLKKTPIPLFCEYDLNSKTVRLLNCLTPKEAFKLDYADKELDHFGCVNGDSLIISSPYKSEVIVYSISQDKELGRVDCKSKFQDGPIKEFGYTGTKKERMKLDRYQTETPFYSTMFYNKARGEYYRIFYHGLPTKNKDGEFTIFQDKVSSVLVLDKNLQPKEEILYGKNSWIVPGITCTKNGFFTNNFRYDQKGNRSVMEVRL